MKLDAKRITDEAARTAGAEDALPAGAMTHTTHDTPLAPHRDILDVIAEAVRDPSVDVAKMERLLALKRDVDAENARKAYKRAMAALQGIVPTITKLGTVERLGTKFERLEDLHKALQKPIADHGFSVDFDCRTEGEKLLYSCTFSHVDGYSETKTLPMDVDHVTTREGKSVRSAAQDVGATTSYARRQLLKMHLNIVARGEDTDGEPIPVINAVTLDAIRADLKDIGRTEEQLCGVLGIGKLEDARENQVKTIEYFVASARKARGK